MINNLIANPKLSISILFVGIGLILLLMAIYYFLQAKESNNWLTISGIILTSEINKINSDSNGFNISYKPEICYSYKVDNEKYVSNKIRIFFNYSTGSSLRANRLVNKYFKDSKVEVYYNPNKPSESVLEPGLKNEVIGFLTIGIVIEIASMVCAFIFM